MGSGKFNAIPPHPTTYRSVRIYRVICSGQEENRLRVHPHQRTHVSVSMHMHYQLASFRQLNLLETC
jgi:hypothetical protein